MDKKELEAAAEAILFTMGNAVEVERIAKAIGMSTEATRKMLRTMKEKYETEGRGIRLIELEDSFQMYHQGIDMLKACNDKMDKIEKQMLVLDSEGETHEFES